MTAPIDYNAVLADLLAKRAQINAAIDGIRVMIGAVAPIDPDAIDDSAMGPTPAPTVAPKPTAPKMATTIESDTFFGLSTADAIRRYLSMMKRPQPAATIAEAMSAGGQINATDAKAAYANVYSALTRNKDFVKTRTKDWGLAEWYANKPKAETD